MTRTAIVLAVSALLATGCHGRYKRNADSLGKVAVDVQINTEPRVDGGEVPLDAPTNAAEAAEAGVRMASVVLGRKAQKKLSRAVDSETAEAVLDDAFDAELARKRLPYKTGDKGRAELVIEVVDFGLDASMGTPEAYVSTVTTIHDKKGKRVYRARETCTREVGPGLGVGLDFTGLGELAAMKALSEMKPKQMEKVVLKVTEQCAGEVADELVKHLR